jgi:hypothetical protein
MSELFSVKENTVTYHIQEIYKTEELEREGTARKIRVVRKEGNRNVRRTLDIRRHNQQYPPIAVNYCQRNHDRFLIIDDVVYVFGASLKDAGKKLFAYIRMQETSAMELLNNLR